ncbi:MAG TPA: helix-turn-helix transcriptional regulator, partial [Candidatus Dormibacteraeota bacterium]
MSLAVLEGSEPAGDGIGDLLARERQQRGLSLEVVAAATRIRVGHLAAIERGDLEALPGPVYARGYVRGYAAYLGISAEVPEPAMEGEGSLSIRRVAPRRMPRLVVTGPLIGGLGLALLSGLFVLYAWREIDSARQDFAPAATARPALSAPPIASPAPLPSVAPTAAVVSAVRPMAVLVRATDQVWIYVEVDGKPYYGPNGKFLAAGDEDGYVGSSIKITTGKPAATLISTDGVHYTAMATTKTKEW